MLKKVWTLYEIGTSEFAIEQSPEGLQLVEDIAKMNIVELRRRLKEYETLCPRCFKPLDQRHIDIITMGLRAIELMPDYLEKIKAKDFCCVECFEEINRA